MVETDKGNHVKKTARGRFILRSQQRKEKKKSREKTETVHKDAVSSVLTSFLFSVPVSFLSKALCLSVLLFYLTLGRNQFWQTNKNKQTNKQTNLDSEDAGDFGNDVFGGGPSRHDSRQMNSDDLRAFQLPRQTRHHVHRVGTTHADAQT